MIWKKYSLPGVEELEWINPDGPGALWLLAREAINPVVHDAVGQSDGISIPHLEFRVVAKALASSFSRYARTASFPANSFFKFSMTLPQDLNFRFNFSHAATL